MQTFADPLGLRETPSLQQLRSALITVSAPDAGSAASGSDAAEGSIAPAVASAPDGAESPAFKSEKEGDGEAELTFPR